MASAADIVLTLASGLGGAVLTAAALGVGNARDRSRRSVADEERDYRAQVRRDIESLAQGQRDLWRELRRGR